jgi:hypothetical protein
MLIDYSCLSLDSAFRSPLFAHFSETLSGVVTVRAFKAQQVYYDAILISPHYILTLEIQRTKLVAT